MAAIPIDYIYLATGTYLNPLRFLRMLKLIRLSTINTNWKTYFDNYHMFNVIKLLLFSLISSHVFACILYVIAKHEYNAGGRFDHKSFVLCSNFLVSLYSPELLVV